jgi:hypothetical protein
MKNGNFMKPPGSPDFMDVCPLKIQVFFLNNLIVAIPD